MVGGRVAESDKLEVKGGAAAAETPPWAESMRMKFVYLPIFSLGKWSKVEGNSMCS